MGDPTDNSQPARSSEALPPGPRAPTLVQTVRFLRDEVGLLDSCRERYGDIFTLRVAGLGRLVVLGDPGDVRRILSLDGERAHAGEARAVLEPLVGTNSILLVDEGPHLHRRRLMLPPFHGDALDVYADVIRELTEQELSRWPVGRSFEV